MFSSEEQHSQGMTAASGSKLHVGYLGPPSSYTHQATVDAFDDQDAYELEPQPTIADVFNGVQNGNLAYGIVPFENSSNGAVVQTLDLFGARDERFSEVVAVGETFVAVHHCLLGYIDANSGADEDGDPESGEATPTRLVPSPARSKVRPKRAVRHVRRVLSHPQAFGQCEAFLSVHLRGAERQEVSSTSRAAQIVADDAGKTSAAIASRMAAQVHGLDILAQGIEDRPDNETRFLILRRRSDGGDASEIAAISGDDAGRSSTHDDWKTLVSFTINHSQTGALSNVLNVFKNYDLNLTSINSRPSRGRPWQYVFFVEFGGRKEVEEEGSVNRALHDLATLTEGCRWHGSWRRRGGN